VHVFLLAGQRPGVSSAAALSTAAGYALAAQRAGFAGVWIAEHHFIPYGTCPSAVAAILSNRHPVALGEEAAMLDELSGGRFALGVARGGPWVDLEVFGTGLDRYEHGFGESLDLLLAWLSGAETVGAAGPRFRFRPVKVVPRPRRPIPTWVAATSEATVDIAARRGLPLLLGLHATDAERAVLLARYAETAAHHGHNPATVPHASAHLAHVDDDDGTAVEVVRRRMPDLLAGTTSYARIDNSAPAHRDLSGYVERLATIGAVGSPATCRRRLAAAVTAAPVRHLLLLVEAGGDPGHVTTNIGRIADTLLA
jgi:alkanesulfonate monooxygenase SsuD/methylene tetrahydromethanopterin reductase-like flavin-dependent oxidoreductase (luciferase family)